MRYYHEGYQVLVIAEEGMYEREEAYIEYLDGPKHETRDWVLSADIVATTEEPSGQVTL